MRYSNETLEYYNNLKNVGCFDETLLSVGTGVVGSPLCGDVMKLQIVFDESDRIKDVKYKVFGCVSAIASMELVCDILKGLTIDEAMKIKNSDVAEKLQLSPIKAHCSVLGKEAIRAAIDDYLNKKKGKHKMITVSNEALEKLRELIGARESCIGVEIVVSGGGCSGVEYFLRYACEISDDYENVVVCGVKFFFQAENKVLVEGLDIDVVPSSVGHGFVVKNKNQLGCCEHCSCKCM